jgi:hypothetical protein
VKLASDHPVTGLRSLRIAPLIILAIAAAAGAEAPSQESYRQSLATHIATFRKDHVSHPELAQEAIDHALQRQDPLTQAAALGDYGQMFESAEDYANAKQLYLRQARILGSTLGDDDARTGDSYRSLARAGLYLGQAVEAEDLFELALKAHRHRLGEDDLDTAESYFELAANKDTLHQTAEAEPLYRKALDIERRKLGEDVILADHEISLADLYADSNRPAEAEPLCREALAIVVAKRGEHDRLAILAYSKLGASLVSQKREGEAFPFVEKAMKLGREAFGPEDVQTATLEGNFAEALDAKARYAEATPLYAHALAVYQRSGKADSIANEISLTRNYAENLHRQRRFAEAVPIDQAALTRSRAFKGEDSSDTAVLYGFLGEDLDWQGKPAEAEAAYRKSLAILSPLDGEARRYTAHFDRALAANLTKQGRAGDATGYAQKADAIEGTATKKR